MPVFYQNSSKWLLLVAMLLIASLASWAAPTPGGADGKHITLPTEANKLDISNRFSVATDPTASKTIDEMALAVFKPLNGVFVAGYSANAHWLKFTVSNPTERIGPWWLELEPPFIDHVDFYESLGIDAAGKEQFRHVKTGDMQPFSKREIPHQSFVFEISPRTVPTAYFLRLQSSGPIWLGARLWHSSAFVAYSVRYGHKQAAAFGAFLLLMLITLVQGLVFKDPAYLAFVAHVGVVLLAQASIVLPLYLPDNWFQLMDTIPIFATCLSVSTYAIFCNYFILSIEQNRVYRWLFFALTAIGVVGALACISPAYRWLLPFILAVKIVGCLVPVIAVSRRLRRSNWYDRLVWLGIVTYVPAQAILLWRLASVSQQDVFWNTLDIFTGVLLAHMILLTFALGERLSRSTRATLELKDQLGTERQLKDLADKTAFDQRSFLSMVAHELRGPLAMMRTSAYNLRQLLAPAQITDQTETRLNNVDMGLQQMASLVAVCLTHEREGFAQPLSLNLRMTLAQLQVRLVPLLSPAVTARVRWADEPENLNESIVCNPALIVIAVRNLIENACRYDPSAASVEVRWQVQYGGPEGVDQWRISVLDRGPGIPAEHTEQIFQPFHRVNHQDDTGLGLGLYIVSRIASMHGAVASVKRREHGGTAFSVAFGF